MPKEKIVGKITELMSDTLFRAYEKQKADIRFGPSDVRGSFGALFARRLIILKNIESGGQVEYKYVVTNEDIDLLKQFGKIKDNVSTSMHFSINVIGYTIPYSLVK